MSTMSIWGLADVSVRAGHKLALDRVSLDVPSGVVTAVVGGDGAGKTTLLRVLVGALRPSAGTVRRPPAEHVGYFSAACGVYDDLTVAENLRFAATAYRARDRRHEAELLAATGLSDVTGRLAGNLSGGMRHKLGLVMAMLHRPSLLVLDEPSTGVDPVSRADLSRMVARAAAEGTAVLLSTVYLDEAERAATVLALDVGRPLCAGAPERIVAALTGRVVATAARPRGTDAWRRHGCWHQWIAPGATVPPDARPAQADLEDAVVVATLERRRS